jgi:hypothetical protein
MKTFTEVERDTKLLRSRAKATADVGLLQTLQNGLEAPVKISSLQTLADEFEECLQTTHTSPDWRTLWLSKAKAAATVLSDCFGIRGGALRRKQDFERSVEAYDQGFVYEGEAEFDIPDSYNRVQRLVVRIVSAKQPLWAPIDLRTVPVSMHGTILEVVRQGPAASRSRRESTVFEQLGEAETAIYSMLHVTKIAEGDLWREADLALVRLLLGSDLPKEKLWAAIPRDTTRVLQSTKRVIDDLAAKFDASESDELKARLEETSDYFAELLET